MITRRISYKTYADKRGINRRLETVKGSYDEANKTIEVLIGIKYAPEYDEVFEALTSEASMIEYMAAQGEAITAEQARGLIADNMDWMREALECTASERDAILAII